jgi:hypothetical protein
MGLRSASRCRASITASLIPTPTPQKEPRGLATAARCIAGILIKRITDTTGMTDITNILECKPQESGVDAVGTLKRIIKR